MTTTMAKPISPAEMARHTARLDRAYREELQAKLKERTEQRFTIEDLSILTGWTKPYFFRLIREKRIPKPKRDGGTRHTLRWTEEQARAIMAFHDEQEKRFG